MAASALRKNDNQWYSELTKNEIVGLQDYEVPCDCISETKFIKTKFSLAFYGKTTRILQIFATKFSQKKLAKCIYFNMQLII